MPINIYKSTKGGMKQYTSDKPFEYHAFEYSEDNLNTKIYFDSSVTITAQGTSTFVERRIGKPIRADKFNFVFNPNANVRPLVGQDRNFTRVTTSAITSGIKVTGTFNLSNDNWFAVVVSNTLPSRAMKLKLNDGTGSETFAFTTSAVANTWQIFKFKKGNGTLSGTPAYGAITTIEITDDLTTAVFDIAAFFSCPEETNFVGEEVIFLGTSINAFGKTYSVDQAELLVQQIVKAKTATKKSLEMTLDIQETSLSQRAIASGNSIGYGQVTIAERVGSYTIPTNGIVTGLPSGLNIAVVSISGASLSESATATNIDEGYFNYTTTTLTVSPAYQGKTIDVSKFVVINANFERDNGLKSGYIGWLLIPQLTDSGTTRYTAIEKCQMLGLEESAGDFDTTKIKLSALAGRNDSLYQTYEI